MTKTKDLESKLLDVDYSKFSNGYTPSEFALKFIAFIKLVNGSMGEANVSPVFHYDMLDQIVEGRQNLFVCFRGGAKCLDINTLVHTPEGLKSLEYIQVGDEVLDRNGKPTKVKVVSEVFTEKPCYKILLSNGDSFTATDDHQHFVQRRTQNKDKKNVWKEEVLTTKELINSGAYYERRVTERNPSGKEVKWKIPVNSSVFEYDGIPTCIDPYTLGLMLGDGNFERSSLCGAKEDMKELEAYIPYEIPYKTFDKRNPNVITFRIENMQNLIKIYTKDFNIVKANKYIPSDFVQNSTKVRLSVLQGLMDSDGTVYKDARLSFSNMSYALCQGVLDIVISLGGKGTITESAVNGTSYYRTNFYISQEFPPFKLKRKLKRWASNRRTVLFNEGIVDIIPVKPIPTKCISVESDTESYIIENGYVTHNTSVIHEYMFLYIACFGSVDGFGKVNVAMYVADTIDNGIKSMRQNLEYRWQHSEFLQKYVPFAKFTDVRWEFKNADGKYFCVRGFGASTGVRGFKEYGQRPTWLGLDDLMSDKNAESPTIVEDIKKVLYRAARQCLDPQKRMTNWTGTPFNKKDPLYEAAGTTSWQTRIYPLCEKFPVKKEDFIGAWEDRFSYEFVKSEYESLKESGELAAFDQELMLRITSDEDRLVNDDDLVWYSRKEVLKNKSNYNFYITTDFGTSENKKADFSVITVWAYNNNRDWMIVDGIAKKQLMDKTLADLFRLVSMYKPLEVGIETSGQQGGFLPWIKSEMLLKNVFFNLAKGFDSQKEGIRPTREKIKRFLLFLPTIRAKKMMLPEEMKGSVYLEELLEELKYATKEGFKSSNDDVVDTLSMLTEIDPILPSAEINTTYTENEYGTYAEFPDNANDFGDDFNSNVF